MKHQPLSREAHQGLHLCAPAQPWMFARNRMVVGVVMAELPEIIKTMPLAFVVHEGKAKMVAVLSLGAHNVFVGGHGEWKGDYIPAAFRAWPFGMMLHGDKRIVAIDIESDALSREAGEPLFDAAGQPSAKLQKTVAFLHSFSKQETAAVDAAQAVHDANVLVPWQPGVDAQTGATLAISGLHRIDTEAFEALPDDAYLALRRAGALPAVYAHVFSQRNLGNLERLARNADKEAEHAPQPLYITDEYLKF